MSVEKSLQTVKETSVLTSEEYNKLAELRQDLELGFSKRQMGRPKYLMEVSVLKDMKFPTPDAKYWQCVLERDIQFQNLVTLSYDFQEKQADIEIKEVEKAQLLKNATKLARAKAKKLEIQIQRDKATLLFMEKQASEMLREIIDWSELTRQLKPQLKYGEDNSEAHMPESFLIRFAYQKKMLDEIGAADMNGAMNIIALGQSAAKYWKQKNGEEPELESNDGVL